jgi:hypothetical protein
MPNWLPFPVNLEVPKGFQAKLVSSGFEVTSHQTLNKDNEIVNVMKIEYEDEIGLTRKVEVPLSPKPEQSESKETTKSECSYSMEVETTTSTSTQSAIRSETKETKSSEISDRVDAMIGSTTTAEESVIVGPEPVDDEVMSSKCVSAYDEEMRMVLERGRNFGNTIIEKGEEFGNTTKMAVLEKGRDLGNKARALYRSMQGMLGKLRKDVSNMVSLPKVQPPTCSSRPFELETLLSKYTEACGATDRFTCTDTTLYKAMMEEIQKTRVDDEPPAVREVKALRRVLDKEIQNEPDAETRWELIEMQKDVSTVLDYLSRHDADGDDKTVDNILTAVKHRLAKKRVDRTLTAMKKTLHKNFIVERRKQQELTRQQMNKMQKTLDFLSDCEVTVKAHKSTTPEIVTVSQKELEALKNDVAKEIERLKEQQWSREMSEKMVRINKTEWDDICQSMEALQRQKEIEQKVSRIKNDVNAISKAVEDIREKEKLRTLEAASERKKAKMEKKLLEVKKVVDTISQDFEKRQPDVRDENNTVDDAKKKKTVPKLLDTRKVWREKVCVFDEGNEDDVFSPEFKKIVMKKRMARSSNARLMRR